MANPGPDAPIEEREKFENWEADKAVRERFKTDIQNLMQEAVEFSLRNSQLYAAVDLAWDTSAISKVNLPLLMYAQGKLNLESCASALAAVPNGQSYVKKNKDNKVEAIDLPKFVDTAINLVRSTVMRRHAAQSVKYANLYPYYKYEARSTGLVGKLKADVMSQEAEIVVDGFGYRHHESQVMRDGFLYGHAVDFIRQPWETFRYQVPDRSVEGFDKLLSSESIKDMPVKSEIYKEGVSFVSPHPSRLIVDMNHPLSAINDDVGPSYIGYWDIVSYKDVRENPKYFNRDSISSSSGGLWSKTVPYQAYLSQYFDQIKAPTFAPTPVSDSAVPPVGVPTSSDPAGDNDRKNATGIYGISDDRQAMFKTELFYKVTPVNHRMGTYPHELWIRLVVAGDSTVIYAEPCYTTPAAALSINENDSRLVNVSFAHDVMWAQDMMTNLVNQMLISVQGEMFKVFGLNKDLLSPEDIQKIETRLGGRDWAAKGPLVIPYSLRSLAEEMDIKMDAVFKIGETTSGNSVQVIFQAMAQLMSLLERLISMSPAEQGQPAPREISATEVTEMAGTTQNVYGSISDSIDEYRAAKKRILYESMVCAKQKRVQVPVLARYSRATVKKAGFAVAGDKEDQNVTEVPQAVNVLGDSIGLVHDYIFTTRDGSERPVNTQAANTLVQLMQVVLQVPAVLEGLGREKIYNIFNEIFRMSGTGMDLLLEVEEGETTGGFGESEIAAMQQLLDQLKASLTEIASMTQQTAQAVQEQEQVNAKQEQVLGGLMETVNLVKKTAADINSLHQRIEKMDKEPEPPEIPYRDAPEETRRQLEERAGYKPAENPTYLEMKLAKEKDVKKSVVAQV